MVDKSLLDQWAIRGFGGILKILEARQGGFSEQSKFILTRYKQRLLDLIAKIESDEQYIEVQVPNLEPIDEWFNAGIINLFGFYLQRLKEGHTDPIRQEIIKQEVKRFLEKL